MTTLTLCRQTFVALLALLSMVGCVSQKTPTPRVPPAVATPVKRGPAYTVSLVTNASIQLTISSVSTNIDSGRTSIVCKVSYSVPAEYVGKPLLWGNSLEVGPMTNGLMSSHISSFPAESGILDVTDEVMLPIMLLTFLVDGVNLTEAIGKVRIACYEAILSDGKPTYGRQMSNRVTFVAVCMARTQSSMGITTTERKLDVIGFPGGD